MDKYTIKLLPKAYKDIDHIYGYIMEEFKEREREIWQKLNFSGWHINDTYGELPKI